MGLQVASSSGRIVALLASKRLLSSVHKHVFLEIASCTARVVTLLASEGLLSTVP